VEIPDVVVYLLVAAVVAGWLLAWILVARTRAAVARADRLETDRRSQATRYGNLSEQFAPWMAGWPFDPQNFRFIGKPIDGVQFEDDAVYFVEIKAASSRLSTDQLAIRKAVLEGRVGWIAFHVAEAKPVEVLEPWKRVFDRRGR